MQHSWISKLIYIPFYSIYYKLFDGCSVVLLEGNPVLAHLPQQEGVGELLDLWVGGVVMDKLEELEEVSFWGLTKQEGDLIEEVGHFWAV